MKSLKISTVAEDHGKLLKERIKGIKAIGMSNLKKGIETADWDLVYSELLFRFDSYCDRKILNYSISDRKQISTSIRDYGIKNIVFALLEDTKIYKIKNEVFSKIEIENIIKSFGDLGEYSELDYLDIARYSFGGKLLGITKIAESLGLPPEDVKHIQSLFYNFDDNMNNTINSISDVSLNTNTKPNKIYSREELMSLLKNRFNIKTVRTSEEFTIDKLEGGIWIVADNEEKINYLKIFDYYNETARYKNGIIKILADKIISGGWKIKWYDRGTLLLWPKNNENI
jgi:hypothetical protein